MVRKRKTRAKTMDRHECNRRWVVGTATHLIGEDTQSIACGVFRFRDEWYIFTEEGTRHRVDPETLGDWSGLYDKNGKPIFEGDVLRFMDSCGIWTAAVEFERGLFGLDVCTQRQIRNPKNWTQPYDKIKSRWWAAEWGYEEWGTAFTFRQPLAQRTVFNLGHGTLAEQTEAYEANWRNAWRKKHGHGKYVVDAVVVGNRYDNPELLRGNSHG